MFFVDHDDRLVAINDEIDMAMVWGHERGWVATGEDFPRKAWLDGEKITKAEASNRFPDVDWDALKLPA